MADVTLRSTMVNDGLCEEAGQVWNELDCLKGGPNPSLKERDQGAKALLLSRATSSHHTPLLASAYL